MSLDSGTDDSGPAGVSLLDEAACLRVISRYSAAVDWAEREALSSIFWPDATMDFGTSFFVGSAADGVEFLLAVINASLCRTHALGTTWLALDGDRARAETPAFNLWVSRNPDGSMTRYFLTTRYLWRLEKRHGEWRVASLKGIVNTAQCTPYDPATQPQGFQLTENLGPMHPLFPGAHV